MKRKLRHAKIGVVPASFTLVFWLLGYATASGQTLADTSLCLGDFLTIEARSDYERYAWSPQEQLVWSVGEKAVLSPKTSQIYTVRARRRLGVEYVDDGEFDREGQNSRSDLPRVSASGFRSGSTAIATNSTMLAGDESGCPEITGRSDAKFLAVFAVANQTVDVWCQRVLVKEGKIYNFRATTSTLLASTVGRIGFTVAGQLINRYVDPYPYACTWREYGVDYQAPETAEVEICIQVKSPANAGSREALDQISFREYDVDYLDTFNVAVLRAPPQLEVGRTICEGTRYQAFGLDLAPGESGIARFAIGNGCDSLVNFTVRGAQKLYSFDTLRGLCFGEQLLLGGVALTADRDTTIVQIGPSHGGCDSISSTTLRIFDAADIKLQVTPPACNALTTTVTILPQSSSATLTWLDGNPDGFLRQLLPTGKRTGYTVRDSLGCEVSLGIDVPSSQGPVINLLSATSPMCFGDTDGFAAAEIAWLGDDPVELALYSGVAKPLALTSEHLLRANHLAVGRYMFSATDSRGCTDTVPFTLVPAEAPTLKIRGDTFILRGLTGHFVLSGADAYAPDRLQWSFGGSLQETLSPEGGRELSLKPASSGWLRVRLSLDNGCMISAERFVTREDPTQPLFPSAFSPNGDGVNDLFKLIDHPGVARLLTFQMYDRWGNLLFSSGDPVAAWTGDGEEISTYVYTAEVLFLDGAVQRISGAVDLLR